MQPLQDASIMKSLRDDLANGGLLPANPTSASRASQGRGGSQTDSAMELGIESAEIEDVIRSMGSALAENDEMVKDPARTVMPVDTSRDDGRASTWQTDSDPTRGDGAAARAQALPNQSPHDAAVVTISDDDESRAVRADPHGNAGGPHPTRLQPPNGSRAPEVVEIESDEGDGNEGESKPTERSSTRRRRPGMRTLPQAMRREPSSSRKSGGGAMYLPSY
mmetsp:Transcript_4013/g.15492  ORF Transcript_4013/g.15492 Transcript_4013/m.15492 type:complete len:221 (-) Transcript_4013:715-1377(-)